MQWLFATRQRTLQLQLTLQGGFWKQTPRLRTRRRLPGRCCKLQKGIWETLLSWITILEILLWHVARHMFQFTEDRRTSLAHIVVHGLCRAKKGNCVLFVILQLLGQMLQGCSVLLPRYDDWGAESRWFFNYFSSHLISSRNRSGQLDCFKCLLGKGKRYHRRVKCPVNLFVPSPFLCFILWIIFPSSCLVDYDFLCNKQLENFDLGYSCYLFIGKNSGGLLLN